MQLLELEHVLQMYRVLLLFITPLNVHEILTATLREDLVVLKTIKLWCWSQPSRTEVSIKA